jgi:hypothetical protein
MIGLAFIAAFATITCSTYVWLGILAEWMRLLAMTLLDVIYRPLLFISRSLEPRINLRFNRRKK